MAFETSATEYVRQTSGYFPIFTNRFFLGLATNRSPLRSPAGVVYENSYRIGKTDSLIDGLNTEISNRATIIRRPGCTAGLTIDSTSIITNENVPGVPLSFYSFHQIDGDIRLFLDTEDYVYLITGDALIPIFDKEADAGQTFYQGVGNSLYITDNKSQKKWLDFGEGEPGNSLAHITATELVDNVAIITAVNNFNEGQQVVISGTSNGGGIFNGTWTITSATGTIFTFSLINSNISAASDDGWASGVWNWGIEAPSEAPTTTITQSGATAVNWQANTWFSTMGILIDSNGNAQQLIGITNGTQFGLSSTGQPPWNHTIGGTTTDGSITWQNIGTLLPWRPSTVYSLYRDPGPQSSCIYDALSNAIYTNHDTQFTPNATTGVVRPPFNGVFGSLYSDNQVDWSCRGRASFIGANKVALWSPNTSYPQDQFVIEQPLPPAPNQTTYCHRAIVGGVSDSSFTEPNWATTAGLVTYDNELIWACLGSATWQAGTNYKAWTNPQNIGFNCIKDSNNNLQVCIQSGISGSTEPYKAWEANHAYSLGDRIFDTNGNVQEVTTAGTSGASQPTWNGTLSGTTNDNTVVWTNVGAGTGWGTSYGVVTNDGSVKWVCVGGASAAVWTANKSYHLPKNGFFAPTATNQFGGASVKDTNGNIQFVIKTGLSGGSTPSWATGEGDTTNDNSIIWINNGPLAENSLSWTSGFSYVYAFKARTKDDPYVSEAPPLWPNPLGAPLGSADGSVSTASPSVTITGGNAGAIITLRGKGSTDPQVDTISIFRTRDGGSTYYWLTDIPNPTPIAGDPGEWTFEDYMPDDPTEDFPGLNTLVIAPIEHFNDPPPSEFKNITQYFGRIFGSVGSTVYSSEGPLVGGSRQPPGNGYTAFNPGIFWTFPSPVTRLVPTAMGLLVFTTSDVGIISGGPNITTMFPNILIPGVGLSSYNALAVQGALIFLLTTDNQCVVLDPNMGISEIGFPVGDKLNLFNPNESYLAFHIQGSDDKALYVADGSTGWYRCNPNQAPDASISGPVWSPKAEIVGGAGAIASLEVSPGVHALVVGGVSPNKPILVRDSYYSVFSDNGTAYSAYATIGSIILANPGQLAELGFITAEYKKVGTSPSVSILLDEIEDCNLSISETSVSGTDVTYTYTVVSGVAPSIGTQLTISGMSDGGNNGTFVVKSLGSGTFTVTNSSGVNSSSQNGVATAFEDVSNYTFSSTSLPPQDSPWLYGTIYTPASLYANRYYFSQSINGQIPRPVACRHMQIKFNFGNNTVQNELLTLTIFGRLWSEI